MNLVDKLMNRFEEIIDSFHSVGEVTAVTANRVDVDIAGGTNNLAYAAHYTPAVGDVVQVIGRPGARFVVGKLRGAGAPSIQAGPVSASTVTAGTVTSTGQLNTVNLVASNQANIGGFGYVTGGLQVGAAEAPVGGRITNREMTTEGNILVKGNVYTNGDFIDNTPSERRLKDEVEEIGDGLAVIRRLVAARWTWRDGRDDRRHVGVYVDEFAEADPDAIRPIVDPSEVPTEEEGHFADGARNYEDRALMAYLVRAVQQLSDRLEAVENR